VWGNPFGGAGSGSGGTGNSGWGVDGSHTLNDDIDGDGQPDPDIVITGDRSPQVVVTTTFVNKDFQCKFVGGRQFTVLARNLQLHFDAIEISGQSYGMEDNGQITPNVSKPGGGYEVQGGHLAPYRNTAFDFEATGTPNGNPTFHTVFIKGTVRRGGAPTVIELKITTNRETSGCI
jgi:hypothetical protein